MRAALATVVLAISVWALSATPTAHACSCMALTPAEAYQQSDAVFVGELIEVRRPTPMLSSMDESRFVFEVTDVYKGAVHRTQSIVTASDGASCGLELSVGTTAIVFAREQEFEITPEAGEYAAGLCGGTAAVGTVVIPESFGAPTAPLPGSSPIGEDDAALAVVLRNWYWFAVPLVVIVASLVVIRRRHSVAPRE
ncbi:MAG: hypothetical protein Q7V57_09585 [Actinomycetota bacterium]|nr:hypothetical protein [Actinomycetota bacterium]